MFNCSKNNSNPLLLFPTTTILLEQFLNIYCCLYTCNIIFNANYPVMLFSHALPFIFYIILYVYVCVPPTLSFNCNYLVLWQTHNFAVKYLLDSIHDIMIHCSLTFCKLSYLINMLWKYFHSSSNEKPKISQSINKYTKFVLWRWCISCVG